MFLAGVFRVFVLFVLFGWCLLVRGGFRRRRSSGGLRWVGWRIEGFRGGSGGFGFIGRFRC